MDTLLSSLLRPDNRERTLSLVRIMMGMVFLNFGVAITLGIPALPRFASVVPFSLGWFAGWIELITGPLIILGLYTRSAAFIASGTMAVGYFARHAPLGYTPVSNGGAAAIALCFVFFYIAVAGGGCWSLDALRLRQSQPRAGS